MCILYLNAKAKLTARGQLVGKTKRNPRLLKFKKTAQDTLKIHLYFDCWNFTICKTSVLFMQSYSVTEWLFLCWTIWSYFSLVVTAWGWISEQLTAIIKTKLPNLAYHSFKFSYRTEKKLAQEINHSIDPTPAQSSTGVVYSYKCSYCKAEYIGHTEQYLAKRISQHSRYPSNIFQHCAATKHKFNENNFKIIQKVSDTRLRMYTEALLIKANQPKINISGGLKLHLAE